MGEPGALAGAKVSFWFKLIEPESERGELKHLSIRRKRNQSEISKVVASEMEGAMWNVAPIS